MKYDIEENAVHVERWYDVGPFPYDGREPRLSGTTEKKGTRYTVSRNGKSLTVFVPFEEAPSGLIPARLIPHIHQALL